MLNKVKERIFNNKVPKILGLIVFAVGVAMGRFLAPVETQIEIQEKIVTKEVVKYVEKKSKEEKRDKEVIIIEVTMPDGTKRKETHIVDKGVINIDTSKESVKEKETIKDIIISASKESPKDWNVAVLVSPSHSEDRIINTGSVSYGVHLQRRILGPFQIGAFAETNKNYGLSLGYTW